MTFLLMLFHDSASGNLFSTIPISTTFLGGLFNVLILALLLLAYALQWFFPWHSMSLLFLQGRKMLSSASIMKADFLLTYSTRLKLNISFKKYKIDLPSKLTGRACWLPGVPPRIVLDRVVWWRQSLRLEC